MEHVLSTVEPERKADSGRFRIGPLFVGIAEEVADHRTRPGALGEHPRACQEERAAVRGGVEHHYGPHRVKDFAPAHPAVPGLRTLKLVIGAGDTGEPVTTRMLPDEE